MIDWVETPKEEEFGSIKLTCEWFYDEESDYGYLGRYVSKTTEDVFFDRRRGVLYGPAVVIQRTFNKREIGTLEVDMLSFHDRNSTPPLQWTEKSESDFLAHLEKEYQEEEDYPGSMTEERFENSAPPEEVEWVLVEVFGDGSAVYEREEPEVLDDSMMGSFPPDRNEYEYIQDFMQIPSNWSDVEEEDRADNIKYCIQDVKRLQGLHNNDWEHIYCVVTATLQGREITADSMGGVESDSGGEHFTAIYEALKLNVMGQVKEWVEGKDETIAKMKADFISAELSLDNYFADKKEQENG